MKVYLDNAATTKCSERVKAKMMRFLDEDYGNPSSLHGMGKTAEDAVKEARERIAGTLHVNEKEIVFTSGGTEANNLALLGTALANRRRGKHIITTAIEHPSVLAPLAFLEKEGYEITYLGVDKEGAIDPGELQNALREDTVLVSVMMVNNEIGTAEPVGEAARLVKEKDPEILFHADAIQAYGKFGISPNRLKIDLLSVSGHKIHAPKGCGFLYIRSGVKISPVLFGGGQQRGMRSGTENVPGIAALGEAAVESHEDFDGRIRHLTELRSRFITKVLRIPEVYVNGRMTGETAPHIVSVSVAGVRSEVLLHALEEKGICVSAGSACSSNKPSVSRTLQGIGLRRELLESTVRFSFSGYTTVEEIDYAVEAMAELIPVLRRYTRR